MHAARAVAEAVLTGRPDLAIHVAVVWMPMLAGDSEQAARRSAAILHDPRVRQFYDPERRVGRAYSTGLFPEAWKEARASLREEHPLQEYVRKAAETPAERKPLWDAALFHPPGSKWTDRPPEPSTFAKQVLFYGAQDPPAPTGLFWRDGFDREPIDSGWYPELRRAVRLLGEEGGVGEHTDR